MLWKYYNDPRSLRIGGQVPPPPRVKVRGSRRSILCLLESLDRCGRLGLAPVSSVCLEDASGLFAVMKDQSRQRLVMDARPANRLEHNVKLWTYTMASAAVLTQLIIPPDCAAVCSFDDLVDYYYQFIVSRERMLRNALKSGWKPPCV